jgi:hypothetical protein
MKVNEVQQDGKKMVRTTSVQYADRFLHEYLIVLHTDVESVKISNM